MDSQTRSVPPVPRLLDIPVGRPEPEWHCHLGLIVASLALGIAVTLLFWLRASA